MIKVEDLLFVCVFFQAEDGIRDLVRSRGLGDVYKRQVLNFQLSNDFHPMRILKGYLERDKASGEYAVLLEWDNIYYLSLIHI